ncbi:MAG: hypothetical protein K1X89_31125, partial [Myxococcaceae bacterium]|nr:hypothetical protein [Myxococcaceae bacterium]
MAVPRPEGHPGEDAGLKLALTRLLVSNRVATKEQVDQAVAAEKTTRGLYVSHLLDTGVSGDKMLALLARAAGLPSAASAWVRKPHADLAAVADGDACRALLAVPFRREGDALHIAFAAPLPKDLCAHLPPHVPHVALEADVRAGLDRLYRSPDLPPPPPSAPGPTVAGLPPPPGVGAPL